MSVKPAFSRGRSGNLWWMVDRDFETPLRELGWPARETAKAWIESGSPASAASTGRGQTRLLDLPQMPGQLILRRTLHGGILGPLWRGHLGSPGRIQRELEVTRALNEAGAQVPCAVLGIAMQSGPLWRASIATLYIPDTVTGLDWLVSTPAEGERRQRVAASVGESLGYFHGCGGQHADLHIGNILIREEDDRVRSWVIDLDKARFDPSRAGPRPTELRRLARSLEKRSGLPAVKPETRDSFSHGYQTGLAKGLDRARR